jgi:hypothetical protein
MARDPINRRLPGYVRPGRCSGGIVLGLVATLILQSVLVVALSGLPAFAASPAPLYASLLVPGLVGLLLLRRRARRAGAGLVLGVAIGAMVAAGGSAILTAVLLASLR